MEELRSVDSLSDSYSTFVHEETPGADVIHVFGEFSYGSFAEIEKALVLSVKIGRLTVCDLLQCTYLDAAGVGVLARARRSLGTSFVIVAPDDGIVRRVLDVTGMTGKCLTESIAEELSL